MYDRHKEVNIQKHHTTIKAKPALTATTETSNAMQKRQLK